ncbi:MAG: xanthine dehydrogenase accessory protein XdhC [Bradymonadia bacterium]
MTQGIFSTLARLAEGRASFVVATVIGAGGSTPRLAGAQMVITADDFEGTIGGGAFEWEVMRLSRALLEDDNRRVERLDVHLVRDLGMCCGGRMEVFMQKHTPAPRLRIYGAGHVGTVLAEGAAKAGFEVMIVDGREAWAQEARFSAEVHVVDADPVEHLRASPPEADERVLVVTHDHALDEDAVRHLVGGAASWVGLVGSRGKWARFRNRLEARGITREALDRVRCPVGLDIGALTPEEIAISILAELVAHRRGVDVR